MSRSFVLFHSLSVKYVFRGRDTFNIINWKRVGATMFKHVTVLLKETVDGLNIKPDGTYVDCTLGEEDIVLIYYPN